LTQLVNPVNWDSLVRVAHLEGGEYDDRRHAWDDPEWFLRYKLQCSLLTDKQAEIAWSLKNHTQTTVKGANSTGKDFTTGRLVLWWQYVHDEAITIVYGPTSRQVSDIIWRNTREGYRGAVGGLPGYMYPRAARYEISDTRYAQGFSADAGGTGSGIQGFHSPHMLVIVTEAQAVEDTEIEALLSLGPERLILTGNPLATAGEFYRSFNQFRELYNPITVSAFDSPNVTEGRIVVPGLATIASIQGWKDRFGENSPVYKARVLGEFPDNTEDAIINLAQAEAAVQRTVQLAGAEAVLGVDVARFGEDDSVIYRRQGAVARKVYKINGRPTTHLAGKVLELVEGDPLIETVVIDTVGVGAGVFDMCRETFARRGLNNRVKLIPFVGGARAHRPTRYFNRIAEAWWRMRQAFDILDIENDDALISQITTRTYELQRDSTIRLESKVKMKERGAPSPDEADALAMTFAYVGAAKKSTRMDRYAQTASNNAMGHTAERYVDTDTGIIPE